MRFDFELKDCIRILLSSLLILSFYSVNPAEVVAADSAKSTESGAKSSEAQQNLFAEIEKFIQSQYPKAKFTKTASSLTFEFKVRSEYSFYNPGKMVMVPQPGGIYGSITIKPGHYSGKDETQLSSEKQEGHHATLKLAPYSTKANSYALVELSFPGEVTSEFKEQFKEIVSGFGDSEAISSAPGEQSKKSAASGESKTSTPPPPAQRSTSRTTQEIASTAPGPTPAIPEVSSSEPVAPGTLFDKRKNLYDSIQKAGQKGIGVSGYMTAFRHIESLVKQGQPEEAISKQVDRIRNELTGQEKEKSSSSAYDKGRALGRIIGREWAHKYGGIPSDAQARQELSSPQFKGRVMQAFLQEVDGYQSMSSADQQKVRAEFDKAWAQQIPELLRSLAVLRQSGFGSKTSN